MVVVEVKVIGGSGGSASVLTLNVKEGQQTFKWLAQVVQARSTVSNSMSAARICASIMNRDNEMVNPRDMIAEHADADGKCSVQAHLLPSFPSDAYGNPIYDDWVCAAYLRSELGIQWASEMNAWRQRLQAAAVDSSGKLIGGMGAAGGGDLGGASTTSGAVGGGNPSAGSSGGTNYLIQIGDEPDPASTFELDWSQMRWQWLDFSGPSHQNTELASLRLVLQEHYHLVIAVFRHYCGSGYVGQRYGMNMSEWAHLLHMLHIVNLATPSGDSNADAYFDRVVGTGAGAGAGAVGASSTPARLMSRPQFAQAVAAIAISHMQASQEPQGSGAGTAGSFAPLLQSFLAGPFSSYWTQLSRCYSRYCISDDLLSVALGDYYQMVKQAFLSFSTVDAERGPEIALQDYMQLLVTSTLVFKDQTTPMIECFLGAQVSLNAGGESESGAGAGAGAAGSMRERELSSLVYCEFLEAVSRLAIQIIDTNASLGPGKRVRMALSMICELQNHPNRLGKSTGKK